MTTNTYNQFATLGKDNVEALVQSGSLAFQGFEALAKAYSAWADTALTQTNTGINKLLAVKSPAEVPALWAELARSNGATAVAETKKIQTLAADVATRSLAPLAARLQSLGNLGKAA